MHKRDILEKYFYPMVRGNEVCRASDEHGTIIVYQFNKFRIMTFDSLCVQSKVRIGDPFYLDHEYIQAMLLPLLHIHPGHVTMLGLGAGSHATCLYHAYVDTQLLAVEWRQSVIDLAYQYFELPEDSRLEVKHREAMSWLEQANNQSTDLLLADLYHADSVHAVQLEKSFFENSYRVLSDKGWLALNYHTLPAAGSPAIQCLRRLFPATFMLQVNTDNWVVLACKHPLTLEAMLSAAPNTLFPASLSSSLRHMQSRLRKLC